MSRSDKSTLRLIGKVVKDIQNATDIFFDNRKYCMWADNIMERCENEENPTVFCDPTNCPLGE